MCLKIIEKVSFNIASEASYVYICVKNAKKGQIVLLDRSILIGQKLVENAKRDIFVEFSNIVNSAVYSDIDISKEAFLKVIWCSLF